MRRLGVLLSMVLVGAGCSREPPPPPDVAVSMIDVEIRYEEFESFLVRTLGESESAMASDVLSGLFDQFLDEFLLRRWIVDEMGGSESSVDDALLVLLGQLPTESPTEAEVREYFEAHREDYRLPERVRLRQILVETLEEAQSAQQALAAQVEFTEVADRYARHPFTPAGGDQGVLAREDLPPAFERVVFALEEGEVSEIVTADYGHHIFQVVEQLPARSAPLEEARFDIEALLRRRKADVELAELVQGAGSRYNVRVHRRNLPFNYDGRYLDDDLTAESSENAYD